MMADEADREAPHAACLRCLHARDGVLEYQAVHRRDPQPSGGHLKNLRVRLAALRVLHRYDGPEASRRVRQAEDQLEVGSWGAGADRLLETGRLQTLQQG